MYHPQGFPILERACNGPAHAISICTTGLVNLVTGTEPLHFSPKRRAFEKARTPSRVYGKTPPWQATKVRLAAVQSIMQSLKVPKGWPPIPVSLESLSTMKLEQALAFAGDMGRYLMGLLDIDPLIHTHMQAYLRVLGDCQQKTPIIPLEDIRNRLHEAAAALEALLPAYWSSITKHHATHLDLFQKFWGCFWAANELIHERIMAKLKRLANHGNRNRMATLANNWDIFQTANWWLLEQDLNLRYKVHDNCYSMQYHMIPWALSQHVTLGSIE